MSEPTSVPTSGLIPAVELGDGLVVGAIGYGAMGLADVYGTADRDESLATVHHALDRGVTLIDTADMYGAGSNEELLSTVLADRRDDVVLATKFGIIGAAGSTDLSVDNDPAYAARAIDASLARLRTDHVDLYYLHRRDPAVPIEDVVGAMADLVSAGKARHIGLSEVTPDELRRAHAVHPITAVQTEWSLWSRDVEDELVPLAAELGVGWVPYSPLGRGLLTGTLSRDDLSGWRAGLERVAGEAFDANAALVERVRALAVRHDATPAQVALAWLRVQGTRLGLPVVPIPGTRRSARVDENLRSLDVALGDTDLVELDAIAAEVVGTRSHTVEPTGWISAKR